MSYYSTPRSPRTDRPTRTRQLTRGRWLEATALTLEVDYDLTPPAVAALLASHRTIATASHRRGDTPARAARLLFATTYGGQR